MTENDSPLSIIILSGRSLFADGIACRLRKRLHNLDIKVADPQQPNTLKQLASTQPSIVIYDATDVYVTERCPIGCVFAIFPSAKVIRISPTDDLIQILTSQHVFARHIDDLVEIIENVD